MSNLYAYKTIFAIESPKALDDFWSFIMSKLNLEQSQYTYDRFARLYNLLSTQRDNLSDYSVIYIILEESDEQFFISIDTILNDFLEEITARLDALNFSYFYESNLLSYAINKKQPYIAPNSVPKKNNYTFMNPQDIEMMYKILERVDVKSYEKEQTFFSMQMLQDFQKALAKYSTLLRLYPQLSILNNILEELSVILLVYPDKTFNAGRDAQTLLVTIFKNLHSWQTKVFKDGSEKLSFMDKEFKNDLSQMKRLLNLYDNFAIKSKNAGDDIFDF